MRRLILFVALVGLLVSLAPDAVQGHAPPPLILNEVELNPRGADFGKEWVELYNPTDEAIDLSGWWIAPQWDRGRTVQLRDHVQISPHRYLVIVFEGLRFSNRDETVVLLDPDKNEVDRTPGPLSDDPGTSGDERCWARVPDARDGNQFRDWQFVPCTPGRPNAHDDEDDEDEDEDDD